MSFAKMKFFIAIILLAACAAVQGRSVQVHPMISMMDYRMGLDTRIIDGHDAQKGLLPWQAALIVSKPPKTVLCGGSLISYNWVLTAAHCLEGATKVRVHLGNVELWTGTEYKETSYKFLHHEKYGTVSLENDIGLIELPTPAVPSANVAAISLPTRSQPDPAGSTVRVSGYGRKLNGETSEILQWVDLTAIENTECEEYHPGYIYPSTLCAKGAPHHSTCKGDSGGPLVQYNPNPVLLGVVSFVANAGCALGVPSAYARVTSYLDWINQHTGIPILD